MEVYDFGGAKVIEVLTQVNLEVVDYGQGGIAVPVRVFDLAVDFDTLEADLLAYDPASSTSPSVTIARKYARVILDAYLASKGGGG